MRNLIVAMSCLAAGAVLMPAPAVQAAWIYNEGEAPVRAAVIEAVRARMGSGVEVTIATLQIRQASGVTLTAPVAAVPDAGARTGGFIRFVLYDGRAARRAATGAAAKPSGRRLGTADAEVFVAAEQVKARRAIAPGTIITADDLDSGRGDVGRLPLRAVPDMRFAIGAKATRPIAVGDRLTAAMILAPTLVKSGDAVQTIVRVGALEAHGVAIATQTGSLGEEIRLVNTSSRRSLRGRVVGAREVEVTYEH
jgi:flagella basal body P-ring formation protein FlgA